MRSLKAGGGLLQAAADRQRFLVFGRSDLSMLSGCVVVCPACDLVGLKTFPVAEPRKGAGDIQQGMKNICLRFRRVSNASKLTVVSASAFLLAILPAFAL